MLSERDLINAIRECETEPFTATKVGKLADLYTVYDHLFGSPPMPLYSLANHVEETTIKTNGDTEFLRVVNGKTNDAVLPEIDEFVSTVQQLHPKMYERFIQNLEKR